MTTHRNSAPPKNKVKKKSWRQITLTILAILVGIAGLGLAGFEGGRKLGIWGESDDVKYLKRDPLASTELPGLRLVHAEQTPDQEFFSIEPPAPYVTRWFEPVDGQMFEQTKADLAEYAEEKGWEYDEEFSTKEYWLGEKPKPWNDDGIVKLQIRIVEPGKRFDNHESASKSIVISLYYM